MSFLLPYDSVINWPLVNGLTCQQLEATSAPTRLYETQWWKGVFNLKTNKRRRFMLLEINFPREKLVGISHISVPSAFVFLPFIASRRQNFLWKCQLRYDLSSSKNNRGLPHIKKYVITLLLLFRL